MLDDFSSVFALALVAFAGFAVVSSILQILIAAARDILKAVLPRK